MSNARPTVSVVIPYYRGERFIRDAVASVLDASQARVEVIVVDDGSPGVAAVDALSRDTGAIVLRHDQNRGIAAARNTGFAAATADWVSFLDQDDMWLPDRSSHFATVMSDAANADVALVFGDVRIVDTSGRVRPRRAPIPTRVDRMTTTELIARIVADNFIRLGACTIRRSAIAAAGRFDERIRGGSDDFDLVLRVAEQGRFVHAPHDVLLRRLHDANYTLAERMIEESLAVIDRTEQRHPSIARAARLGRGRKLYRLASDQYVAGARDRAHRDYGRAIAAWPWQPRAWLGWTLCALGPIGNSVVRGWRRIHGRG